MRDSEGEKRKESKSEGDYKVDGRMGILGFSSLANLFIEMPNKHYITASLLVLESFMRMSLTISSIQQIVSCNFDKIMREMKRVCLFILKYMSLMTDLFAGNVCF